MNYTVNTLMSKSSLSAYKGDFIVLVDWMVLHAFLARLPEMVQSSVPERSALTPLSPPQ